MEIITEPALEIGMATIGLIFFVGFGSGLAVAIYTIRDYFRKAEAAGKVPTWRSYGSRKA